MTQRDEPPTTTKLSRNKERWADAPGYWEVRGYHNRGDPWAEQRYSAD